MRKLLTVLNAVLRDRASWCLKTFDEQHSGSVVRALPWRIWLIDLFSGHDGYVYHHTTGSNPWLDCGPAAIRLALRFDHLETARFVQIAVAEIVT